MQGSSATTTGGHSLYEILIVVLVLGVLAALITPRFTLARSAQEVDETPYLCDLLQRQVDMFHERNGRYPNLVEMQRRPSDVTLGEGLGVLVDELYLGRAPVNPRTGGSRVPQDWEYDSQTGRVVPAGVSDAR